MRIAARAKPGAGRDGGARPAGAGGEPPDGGRPPGTRQRCLDLAVELAGAGAGAASAWQYAVAYVSVNDVAEAARVTRSAIYRIWPSRQDFWADLIDYLLGPEASGSPRRHTAGGGPATGLDVEVPLATVFDAAQDVLLADPLPLLRAGIVAYPGRSAVAGALEDQRSTLVVELGGQLLTRLSSVRSRCGDGFTVADIAVAMTIVGHGLPVTARMTPDHELSFIPSAPAPGAATPRTFLGGLLAAVHDHLTEPAPRGTPPPAGAAGPDQGRLLPASHPGPAEPARWSGRRGRYLQLAASLALDARARADHSHVLGHLGLDALARAAAVSRRTLTNLWPVQAQFRLDLFSHLLERERRWVTQAIGDAAQLASATGDADLAFATVGDLVHRQVVRHLDDVSFLAYAPHLDGPEVSGRARHGHGRHLDDAARHLRGLLAAVRRRPRPGVSLRQLALALFTLSDGANRLARTHRGLVRDEIASRGRVHTLTGHVAAAVLEGLTEPFDDGPPSASSLAAWLA